MNPIFTSHVRIFTTQSGSTFTITPAGEELGWLVHYVTKQGVLTVFTCDDYARTTDYPLEDRMRFFGQAIVQADADGRIPTMTSKVVSERTVAFANKEEANT